MAHALSHQSLRWIAILIIRLIFSSRAMVVSAAAAAAPSSSAVGEMDMDEIVSPLYPRFMFGSPPRLAARQAVINCPVGESSCLAINATGCCPNDNYCYINPAGEPKCCAAGSRCDDPCPISAYRCTVSSTTSCCNRACPAPSGYQCPQSIGGGCCSVDSVCLSGNSCSKTIDPATVNTVSPSPTGCTSNQFSCPASVGGGCCTSGQTCTALGTTLLCIDGPGGSTATRPTSSGGALDTGTALSNAGALLPTSTSSSTAGASSQGLSSGAKIGLGVGIPLAVIVLALALFVFLRRRRTQHDSEPKSNTPPHHSSSALPQSSASTPGTHTQNLNASDYIGANPQPGPYTTLHTSAANAVGMTRFNPQSSSAALQQDASNRGGVPLSPHSPGDITTPVEMAESEASQAGGTPLASGSSQSPRGGGVRGNGDYFTVRQSRVRELEGASSPPAELPGTPMEKP